MRGMRNVAGAAAVALAGFGLAAGCEELAGSGGPDGYRVTSAEGADGRPQWTVTTRIHGTDKKTGNEFPVAMTVTGLGGAEWAASMTNQTVEIRLVAEPSAPPFPEEVLFFVPDGQRRVDVGWGTPGSEIVNSTTVPTYEVGTNAGTLRVLIGSKFAKGHIGDIELYITDDQIRGMAEMLRRLDASGG